MFQAEFRKYAKFAKNPLQTHEKMRPPNCQFSQKKKTCQGLGNVRKILGKKTMYAIACKISGDFHSYSLGCNLVQSNSYLGIIRIAWKLL